MPKMPGGDDGEKKEETAESREEAKEQVNIADGSILVVNRPFLKTFWLKSYRIRSAWDSKLSKTRRRREPSSTKNKERRRRWRGAKSVKRLFFIQEILLLFSAILEPDKSMFLDFDSLFHIISLWHYIFPCRQCCSELKVSLWSKTLKLVNLSVSLFWNFQHSIEKNLEIFVISMIPGVF